MNKMENSFEEGNEGEDHVQEQVGADEEVDDQENVEQKEQEDEVEQQQAESEDEESQQQEIQDSDNHEENEANESENEAATSEDRFVSSKKKRQILSEDESEDGLQDGEVGQPSEEEDIEEEVVTKKKKKHKKHKSHKKAHKKHKERDQDEAASSQDEEEEETNDQELQEEVDDLNSGEKASEQQNESDDDSGPNQEVGKKMTGDSNLDRVLSTQKAFNKRKNRRKVDSEELNEMDNTISSVINMMKNVAAEDRAANEKGLTSIGKIKMLPSVIGMLQKSDYHSAMIDLGILHAIAEWLAPLPDRSLPNIKIREALVDALRDFGDIGSDYLKSSGVGKAVMFLYKHSKETKQNKQKLEKLIHNWSRPIFNLDANYKQLSKEERLQRDIEQVRSMRRNSGDGPGQSVDDLLSAGDKKKRKMRSGVESERSDADDPNKVLRPGDPGFIPRARVPVPTHKDYIIRPKSNVDVSDSSAKKIKKAETRLEKHQKKFVEYKRTNKFHRAVTMSVNDKG